MVCRGLQIHCRCGDQQLADAREWLLIGLSLWVLLFILLQVALSANQHGWHGYVHYVCILIDWPGLACIRAARCCYGLEPEVGI
ncbi:hypothetical protein SynROS8604_01949 [Synechococcus sp. ROS8604]|nr:hypothetical protein SynROS8604_01949 [Synechococcus sp. ROS8604]